VDDILNGLTAFARPESPPPAFLSEEASEIFIAAYKEKFIHSPGQHVHHLLVTSDSNLCQCPGAAGERH
jgi:hypothetical protein